MNVCKYLERYACRGKSLFENPNGFFFKEPRRRFPASQKNGRISLMLRENNLLRGGDRANDSRFLEKYAYKADMGESFDRFNGILTGGTCNCVGVLSLSKPGGGDSIPQSEFWWGKKYIFLR